MRKLILIGCLFIFGCEASSSCIPEDKFHRGDVVRVKGLGIRASVENVFLTTCSILYINEYGEIHRETIYNDQLELVKKVDRMEKE
ncbi:MAG: hypothetical protein AABY22_15555 [Nanoarchaeota archaeon]